MMTTLSIRLLGHFQLICDGEPVAKSLRSRQQSLLAYLLIHRHRAHSRRSIAFLFWPDSNEKQAHTNLRTLLTSLHKDFPESKHFLQVNRKMLQWNIDQTFKLDIALFAELIQQAEKAESTGNIIEAIKALKQAIDLYSADLLPELHDDWILAAQQNLHNQFFMAAERLIKLLRYQCDYVAAIHYAKRLLQHDPLSETTYYQLMELHFLNGDRTSVLRVYQTCQEVIKKELEVEPSPAIQELYERLINLAPFKVKNPELTNGLAITSISIAQQRESEQLVTISRHLAEAQLHFAGATYFLVSLSKRLAKQNHLELAWNLLDQAFAMITDPAEHIWEAELHRTMGNLLWQQGNQIADVEACFVQAIEIARSQNAQFLELSATVNLCTLWQQQGKHREAYQQIAQFYTRFAPGFEALDLNSLNTLLGDLL
ncbi:MAG: BTAD domain-containing putative transcriptional regulator [Chloroflexi bacterium]|nr:BTAD domain-containing putative transcriptional regulator [Chloroflexota bacterium]